MGNASRLRRVTDLFVEGTTYDTGQVDEQGRPILVWVNKLNAFEVDEARMDGSAARGGRISTLKKPDNPEAAGVAAQIEDWPHELLAERYIAFEGNERYIQALDDVRSDEGWADVVDGDSRLPELLDDADVPDDDERRIEHTARQLAYLEAIRDRQIQLQDEAQHEAMQTELPDLRRKYLEKWREQMAVGEFFAEQRVTQLFFAARDCAGVPFEADNERSDEWGRPAFDHSSCAGHRERLLQARSQVRTLSDTLANDLAQILDDISAPAKVAGNSAAPSPSSGSSGQRSSSEDPSLPSTPEEIPSVPATT